MKSVMFANAIIKTSLIVCVTLSAMFFGKQWILGWYLLLPFIGYSYKNDDNPERKE